jgi:hypothetical protein
MENVLTAASVLLCPHEDPVLIIPSQHVLLVDDKPVLTRADLLAGKVPTCRNIGPGLTPCGGITSVIDGLSTTLRVRGEPVALATARGLTAAVPGPVQWKVDSVKQQKLGAT